MGLKPADTESYLSWREFLLSLRGRGLSGVRLMVSDAHDRLAREAWEVFSGAAWQRCIANLECDVAERCRRRGNVQAAAAALKKAFTESDPALVRAGYRRATGLLAEVDGRGAALLEEAEPAALAYLAFPREHGRRIRTNNIQERMNAEVKRRTRVVQTFPSEAPLVRLVGAV